MNRQRAEARVSGSDPATVRIVALPPRVARRHIALAILGSFAVFALLTLVFEIRRGSFSDGFQWVASLGVGLFLWSFLDHRVGTEVTFSKEGVTASPRGRDPWSLSYEDLSQFRMDYEKFGDRIEAMVFVHSEGEYRVEGTFRVERPLIGQAIGMIHLGNADTQIEDLRALSEGRLAAYLYDRRYVLEPISMEEGRTYRYRFAPEMKARWNSDVWQWAQLPMALFLVAGGLRAILVSVGVGSVAAVLLYHRFRPLLAFSRSFEDRFTVTADGLQVTRGKKVWHFVDPRPSEETRFLLPEIGPGWVEYRNGRRRYLLDPRLIEEDV